MSNLTNSGAAAAQAVGAALPSASGPSRANRTMADIARLFMNGATPRGNLPVRQSPGQRNGAAPAVLDHGPSPEPIAEPGNDVAASAQVALLDANGSPGYSALLDAARRIASRNMGAVGLVACDGEYLRIIRIDGANARPATPTPAAAPHAGADVQVARTLYALKSRVQRWLVALPRFQEHLTRSLLATGDWLLVSGTDNDALIASYRTLKGVCALLPAGAARPRRVELLVQTDDQAEATRVHARLNHVARGFLEQELQALAAGPARPATAESALALRVADLEPSAVEASWYAALDFVHDVIGSSVIEEEGHSPDPDEPAAAAPAAPVPTASAAPVPAASAASVPVAMTASALSGHSDEMDDGGAPAGGKSLHEWPAMKNRAFTLDIDAGDISSVLDPEERTVLAECMADLLAPPAEQTAEVANAPVAADAEPVPDPVSISPDACAAPADAPFTRSEEARDAAPPAAADPSMGVPALRAIGLDGVENDHALWSALRPAVRELVPTATILDAAPPHDRSSLLLLDAAGRLHVALLADQDPLRWATLWQWATDHRAVLALTRGAESMDIAAEVQVHIVLSPEAIQLQARSLPAFVHTYRVHRARFGPHLAAIIVPQS